MELCVQNLEQYIHGERPRCVDTKGPSFVAKDCSLPEAVRNIWVIMTQIARGVEFIHRRQCVHRDLKPQNSNF